MPVRGLKHKSRHVKAKKQKKKYMRAKDPILAVLMWGIQHSINEVTTQPEPALLLEEDFKSYSKIRVENQYYNKENLPGHFKFKEYCPQVFHDLRRRFMVDDIEYMNSLIIRSPISTDSPGHSGAKFFVSYDKKLVIKSLSSEEVALLHQILPTYHAHIVTQEGETLLPHYLGMYRLTVANIETYWIVMRSVFSCQVKVHLKFDLKGSTVDRTASDKEKAKTNPTLKDNDFTQMASKIKIGEQSKREIFSKLEADVNLLQSLNLMDYSLLVGIHDCQAPPTDSDDEITEDDTDGFLSGGEDLATPPTSPLGLNTSPNPLTEISDLESPEVPVTDTPIVETMPTTPPTLEVATEYQQKVTINDEITEIPDDGVVCRPAVVYGEKAVESAVIDGFFPVVDKQVDVFAVPCAEESDKPCVYFLALIDVLTNYGGRKRAAHAAKTMKHGAGAEISTVKPEQYARRFLDFLQRNIE